jgi:hypothetical protein
MRKWNLHGKTAVMSSFGLIAVIGLLVPSLVLGSGQAAAAGRHIVRARPGIARPMTGSVSYPVKAFSQEFHKNTQYFCNSSDCNGNPTNAYGTVDRVAGNFSNGGYGNYAPFTAALDTSSSTGGYMAVISGDADGNQGAGCPSSVTEYCTGPYAVFGTGAGKGMWDVFPTGGFTVTVDDYLSPTTAGPAGSVVDNDVILNNNQGAYGIDNIITACAEPTSGGPMGFALNFGHNSPGSCSGTPVVTQDGWYRFVWVFTDNDGYAYLTESVFSEGSSLTLMATSTPQPVSGSQTHVSAWGGPGVLWFPTEDISGLPIANFDVQVGDHAQGEAA